MNEKNEEIIIPEVPIENIPSNNGTSEVKENQNALAEVIVVDDEPKKERQKAKVTYENGKVKSVKKVLTKEEKKKKKIEKKGKRHYWWRYLLVFFAGVIFPFVAIAGTAVVTASLFTTSQIVELFGASPDDYFTETYQDKTILELIYCFADGTIELDGLGGLREVTPYVDVLVDTVNETLYDFIGYRINKEELYEQKWEDIGNYIFVSLQNGIELPKILGVNENSSPVLIYLSYKQNEDGSTNYDAPRTLGDLMNNMNDIIDNARIGDLLDVGTNGILYNLRNVKVKDMANAMNTMPLNEIIDITPDAFPALIYIGQFSVNELSTALENATLGELLPIEEDSILYELRDCKISEISEEIQNLKLGDVIEINENSNSVLKYLKDTKIRDLTTAINDMPLSAAIDIDENSPKFLQTLKEKGATLSNVQEFIDTLTLKDMVDVEGSKILEALGGSTLQSLGEDVNNLTLGQVIDVDDPNAPLILKNLAGVKINELGDAIHNLEIEDIIEIKEDSPVILKALRGTKFEDLGAKIESLQMKDIFTEEEIADCIFLRAMGGDTRLDDMANRITELTFVDVFKDDIFENPNDPSTLKSSWKYLLKDEEGNIRLDYKLTKDMDILIENMHRNFQDASLDELYEDGFLDESLGSTLDKTIAGQRIGDLTLKELLTLIGNVL